MRLSGLGAIVVAAETIPWHRPGILWGEGRSAMRILALFLILLLLTGTAQAGLAPPGAGAAHPTTPEDVKKLLDLVFQSTEPSLRFVYSLEVSVSFKYEGEALSDMQRYRCEVIHDRGTIDVRRDRLVGITAGSENMHFVTRSGPALVLYDFNPCSWTDLPPSAPNATTYTLRPITDTGQPPADPADGQTADVMGSMAVLDSATAARHISTYDLTSFETLPAVTGFQMTATATHRLPINTLGLDVPSIEGPDRSAGETVSTRTGALLFQATEVDGPANPAQDRNLAALMGRKHWVIAEGVSRAFNGKDVAISIGDDPGEINLTPGSDPARQTGEMLSWADERLPSEPFGNGTYKRWLFHVCIEGECVELRKAASAIGGTDTSYYTLFHPPTGRIILLTVVEDDLERFTTSDDLSDLFR